MSALTSRAGDLWASMTAGRLPGSRHEAVVGHLQFGPDRVAATWRLGMLAWPFLGETAKINAAESVAGALEKLACSHRWDRVHRAYPPGDHIRRAAAAFDPYHGAQEQWDQLTNWGATVINDSAAMSAELYLTVDLGKRDGDSVLRRAARSIERGFDVQLPPTPEEVDTFSETADRMLRTWQNHSRMQTREATTLEVEWLLRRAQTRSVRDPFSREAWRLDAMAVQGDADFLSGEVLAHYARPRIREAHPFLEVTPDDGGEPVWQAVLVAGALPFKSTFPGNAELMFDRIQAVEFPVDASLTLHRVSTTKARLKAQLRKEGAEGEELEENRTNPYGPSEATSRRRQLAQNYAARQEAGAGEWRGKPRYYLAARSREELEKHVEQFKAALTKPELHIPPVQAALWIDSLPRPNLDAKPPSAALWDELITADQAAAMAPYAMEEVGSTTGALYGYVPGPTMRPVRWNPTDMPSADKPPVRLLIGAPGSGKTQALMWAMFQSAARGSLVIDFDPKPDHAWQETADAGLLDGISVIAFDGNRYAGALDPLVVAPEEARADAALSVMEGLASAELWGSGGETAASTAVSRALNAGRPYMGAVLDELRLIAEDRNSVGAGLAASATEVQAARDLYRLLHSLAEAGSLGAMLFASAPGQGIDAEETLRVAQRVVSLRISSGLSMPQDDQERRSRSGRLTLAVLRCLQLFIMRLIDQDKHRHKLLVLDEGWFFLATPFGRRMFTDFARVARSKNVTLLIATQRMADIDQELADLLLEIHCLGITGTDAERVLFAMGLATPDTIDEHQNQLRKMADWEKGRGMLLDKDGRIANLKTHIPQELLDVWDTTPGPAKRIHA